MHAVIIMEKCSVLTVFPQSDAHRPINWPPNLGLCTLWTNADSENLAPPARSGNASWNVGIRPHTMTVECNWFFFVCFWKGNVGHFEADFEADFELPTQSKLVTIFSSASNNWQSTVMTLFRVFFILFFYFIFFWVSQQPTNMAVPEQIQTQSIRWLCDMIDKALSKQVSHIGCLRYPYRIYIPIGPLYLGNPRQLTGWQVQVF